MFLIQHFLEQLSTINCPENYVKSKLYTNKCSLLCNQICQAIYIYIYISHETLKMVYYSYFHSNMNYEINILGNSSYSVKIFRIQKNIIRILMGHRYTDSGIDLLQKLKIVPLQLQHTLSLLVFVVNNNDQHKVNLETDSINTRPNSYLHQIQQNTKKESNILASRSLTISL